MNWVISWPSSQISQPKTPGRDGGLFPVIFHEADVVLARVDADGFQRLEVEFDRVAGIGFQDDLELGVLLEAVGVFAVAPVIGADGGFDVATFHGSGPSTRRKVEGFIVPAPTWV